MSFFIVQLLYFSIRDDIESEKDNKTADDTGGMELTREVIEKLDEVNKEFAEGKET